MTVTAVPTTNWTRKQSDFRAAICLLIVIFIWPFVSSWRVAIGHYNVTGVRLAVGALSVVAIGLYAAMAYGLYTGSARWVIASIVAYIAACNIRAFLHLNADYD